MPPKTIKIDGKKLPSMPLCFHKCENNIWQDLCEYKCQCQRFEKCKNALVERPKIVGLEICLLNTTCVVKGSQRPTRLWWSSELDFLRLIVPLETSYHEQKNCKFITKILIAGFHSGQRNTCSFLAFPRDTPLLDYNAYADWVHILSYIKLPTTLEYDTLNISSFPQESCDICKDLVFIFRYSSINGVAILHFKPFKDFLHIWLLWQSNNHFRTISMDLNS